MNKCYAVLANIVRPFFCFTHPARVTGRENIPEGGLMVCSNHSGLSDPLYLIYAMGVPNAPRFMAKEELRKIPVIGFILKSIGLIFVKRGQNDIGAVKTILKALKGGDRICVFPEGTRHDEVGEGKSGAAMMAIRAGVPILPVYIPAKKKWFRRIPVVIGEAYLPFTEERRPNNEDYRLATEELMERIAKLGEAAQ